MEFLLEQEELLSVLMSILCGGIIGFEREYNNKSAGFRTIILICLGSTIFTIVSRHGAGSDDRIAANIITGIGFIGAGVIFKDKISVLGLTTAAVIWTTAGIGMTTGIGLHFLAFCLTIFTIFILAFFGKIEFVIERTKHTKMLNITFYNTDLQNMYEVEELLNSMNVRNKRSMMTKGDGKLSAYIKVTGTQKQFAKLDEELMKVVSISDFY